MTPEFLDQLDAAGYNREKLIELMHGIDEQKRSIKSYLRQLSSEPTENTPRGRERQTLIRRALDKQRFLKDERELVRNRIGKINERKKSLNRAANTRSAEYRDAFFAAALEILDEETLVEIELNASVMMEDLAHNAGRYARRRIDEIRKQAHAGL